MAKRRTPWSALADEIEAEGPAGWLWIGGAVVVLAVATGFGVGWLLDLI